MPSTPISNLDFFSFSLSVGRFLFQIPFKIYFFQTFFTFFCNPNETHQVLILEDIHFLYFWNAFGLASFSKGEKKKLASFSKGEMMNFCHFSQ